MVDTATHTDARYILIAEDNAGDVSLIQLALAEEGIGLEVVVQPDGEQAVLFLDEVNAGARQSPSLVILDLNLPRVDGREILQRIRRAERWGDVPVIVFSSSDSHRDRQVAIDLGATMYLKKPSNLDDFLQVGKLLKSLLDQRAAAAG